MTTNLNKKPSKGILKTSRSVDSHENAATSSKRSKEQRFDEMNIIETFHPANKDYGHMRIDEPKTPYSESKESRVDPGDEVDANLLAAKLAASMNKPPRCLEPPPPDPESDSDETEEERQHRLQFEKKRKQHYNEFQALQLARKLMAQEEEDDEDMNNKPTTSS